MPHHALHRLAHGLGRGLVQVNEDGRHAIGVERPVVVSRHPANQQRAAGPPSERRRSFGYPGWPAEELHLPVEDGKVLYPDAQLEFTEEDGVTRGHVNLEVVSEHYRGGDIAAKAAAGFQMHGNGSARAQALISAVRAAAGGGGGGGSGPRRGEGLMEL